MAKRDCGGGLVNGEDLSDEQLMLMFRYGNRSAFTLLFEKHQTSVYGFARRMLGDRHAAEDACQEAFLRLVASAQRYEPTARFRTWLFTIVRNCCVSALRRRPRAAAPLPDGYPDRGGEPPSGAATTAETAEVLERAIAGLPDAWREAFLLRCRCGLSYDDIAEATGQPVGTVKTHLHRARLRLAREIGDHKEPGNDL
jgi:RNA polymerase sigma-70 factor (ECF subfamily)